MKGHHYGLRAIAARLDVSRNTVINWRDHRGLLMYHRQRGPRLVWYTNDALILQWEIARSVFDTRMARERSSKGRHERPA